LKRAIANFARVRLAYEHFKALVGVVERDRTVTVAPPERPLRPEARERAIALGLPG